ncbi:MAG TPA: Crp/Fnr family transcriptional regulator [Rectinemataceae bacterium]|nr:Crp/Fnr family transcriptional regulator [Rectinemataceae bacterium]
MKDAETRFIKTFGSLFPERELPAAELRAILDSILYRRLDAGSVILREGESCAAVPFVLQGAIRVYKSAESGREITLYRIVTGQSCILSSGCAAGIEPFPATAVAEERTEAAFLLAATVRRLFAQGAAFRDFVLGQYSRRMADVIELVEEVAFRHVDQRLKEWLAERRAESGGERIRTTHQVIADQLGTSREVVSRILKDWELRGALSIARGEIRLLPPFDSLRV